jgi:hypothetical protein
LKTGGLVTWLALRSWSWSALAGCELAIEAAGFSVGGSGFDLVELMPEATPTLPPGNPCTEPVEGFERLHQEGPQRELPERIDGTEVFAAWHRYCFLTVSSVIAHDLDTDGDVNVPYANPEGFPHRNLNDGQDAFTQRIIERDVRGP